MMALVMRLFVHTAVKFSHMNDVSSTTRDGKTDDKMHLSLYSKWHSMYIL